MLFPSQVQDEKRIWRCGGRIQNADLTYSTKHPILIARSHYLATLLVWRAHERVFHGGVKTTLTELRSQFWIICGRSLVKQLIGKCVIRRRFEGKPYNAPIPPPLPPFRVQEAPPFSSTGVDFAGPLYIKQHENELSTDFAKRRCDVFRCMNVMKVVVEGTIDFSCV